MFHCDQRRALNRTNNIKINQTRSGLDICLAPRSTKRQRIILLHLVSTEFIKGGLEVVEDNGICEAFEDEWEFPEWVDVSDWKDWCYGEEIDDYEDDADGHAQEEEAEARGDADKFDIFKLVAVFNVPE